MQNPETDLTLQQLQAIKKMALLNGIYTIEHQAERSKH